MRKITLFLFSLLTLLTSVTVANAQETKSPYKVDFNSAIATDDHAFLVDVGWEHVVGTVETWGGATKYVPYKYKTEGGYEGGYLSVGNQYLSQGAGMYDFALDYLVTPTIMSGGESTIYVKKEGTEQCFVKVYKMKMSGGKYVIADQTPIYASDADEDFSAATGWYQVVIPEVNNVRLGIYASNVGLDDFEAENAKIELKKELSITSSSSIDAYTNADENGNYTFGFDVTIKNTGGATLKPGDTGYQVDIKNASGKVVKTILIDKTLAAGESYTIPISVTLNIADYPAASDYYVCEGISKSTTKIAKVTPVPYAPVLKVANGSDVVEDGFSLNFGVVKEATSKYLTITNDGGKLLTISKISVPEGFGVDVATPLTIEPHENIKVKVTMEVANVGEKAGTLEIESDGGNKTISLKGTVLAADAWFADFEDGKLPAGMIVNKDGVWSAKLKGNALRTDVDKYAGNAYGSNEAILVTPLFNVKKGDILSFDVAKTLTSSALVVKYSEDRVHWTVAKEFTSSDLSNEQYNGYYIFTPVSVEIPEGNYYVGFESKAISIDNIYGLSLADVPHDWYLKSTSINNQAEVNSKLEAFATLFNVGINPEIANTYTATLYVDGKAVAQADPVLLEGGATQTFNFVYTPHVAGTYKAYVEFATGDYKVVSNVTDVTVTDEQAVSNIQVGEPDSRNYYGAPVNLYYNNSETVTLFPASKLTNITKGTKINKMIFKGSVGDTKFLNSDPHITIWLANVSEETLEKPVSTPSTEGMTKVFDDTYSFTTVNSGDSFDKDADIFTIEFAEPFAYEGNGISMVCSSKVDGYVNVKFQRVKQEEKLSYYRANDGAAINGSFESASLPVVHFVVANEPVTVIGTVTNSETNEPVANVDIKFVADDVEYYGKTDESGHYSIDVIKSDLTYKAEISAEGYKTLSNADVDLATANDFKLVSNTPTGISEVVASDAANANVYNAQGILVSKSGLADLKPGLYIVNGKKVIKK